MDLRAGSEVVNFFVFLVFVASFMVSSVLIAFFIVISSSSICAEGTRGRKEEVDISPV